MKVSHRCAIAVLAFLSCRCQLIALVNLQWSLQLEKLIQLLYAAHLYVIQVVKYVSLVGVVLQPIINLQLLLLHQWLLHWNGKLRLPLL